MLLDFAGTINDDMSNYDEVSIEFVFLSILFEKTQLFIMFFQFLGECLASDHR